MLQLTCDLKSLIMSCNVIMQFLFPVAVLALLQFNRPIRLTQCCTQFKSPGVTILCVLNLNYNAHGIHI